MYLKRFLILLLIIMTSINTSYSFNTDSLKRKINSSSDDVKIRLIKDYFENVSLNSKLDFDIIKSYINHAKKHNMTIDIGRAYFFEGNYYLDKKQLDSAYRSYSLALEYFKDSNSSHRVASTYTNMGIALKNWGANYKAIEAYTNALKLTAINNHDDRAKINYNIAILYDNLHQLHKSLEYVNISQEHLLKSAKSAGIYMVFHHKAYLFSDLKMPDSSIYYARKSMAIIDKGSDVSAKVIIRQTLANSYLQIGRLDSALEIAKYSLALAQQNSEQSGLSMAYYLSGNVYSAYKNYANSAKYYKLAYPLFIKENRNKIAILAMDSLAYAYGQLNQSKLQADIISLRLKYSDSINSYKIEKGIANIYNQVAIENSIKSMRQLKAENSYKDEVISRQNIALTFVIGFICMLILLFFTIYYYYKKIKKLNFELSNSNIEIQNSKVELDKLVSELQKREKELYESNNSKDKLFSIVSHDLRGPITFYSSTLEIFKSSYKEMESKETDEWLNSMICSSKRIIDLLKNLLMWTSVQRNKIYFNPAKNRLADVTNYAKSDVSSQAEIKSINIEITNNVSDDIVIMDAEIARTIIRNFLSNAIRHSPDNSKINILINETKNQFEISVVDQGKGIKPEIIEFINTADHKSIMEYSNSSGIGLMLSKELADLHHGNIIFSSIVNQGTTAKFVFDKQIDLTDDKLNSSEKSIFPDEFYYKSDS